MYLSPSARLAVYAEGEFGKGHSKTAEGVIRYAQNPIAAVIDSTCAGKSVASMVGIDSPAPIVASVDDSLQYKPDALLIGTAWTGGHLPEGWRKDILTALKAGLDVVNGLHDFLEDDPEISRVAFELKRKLYDVRRAPDRLPVASGKARHTQAFRVLTIGTDCSVGKMTASLEMAAEARKRGYKCEFVATGQTGIMIAGGLGIAIDRVIGDFMAGATEKMVVEAAPGQDFVFVEGQGSLAHPGFSGVTLALMHGAAADAMILVHKCAKRIICELEDFPIPDLKRIIEVSETMSSFVNPCKVVAVALNTAGLTDEQARQAVQSAEFQTQLPATDPVRFGAGPLIDALVAAKEKKK